MELSGPFDRMKGMDSSSPVISRLTGLSSLEDRELLALMKRIAAAERAVSVYALAHLAEIQRRKLYEGAGYATMFSYCVGELRYSEATAYRRLQSAEAIRKFPEALSLLKDGGLTVCALSLIAKHLTRENSERVFKQIEGKSVRDVERLAAELAPLPDTRDSIRRAAAPKEAAPPAGWPRSIATAAASAPPEEAALVSSTAPAPSLPPASTLPSSEVPAQAASRDKIMPRSPGRALFRFTGGEELCRTIDRLRELMWHKYPEGKLEDVLLEAGRLYLALKDPELQLPSKPRPPRAKETHTSPRWVRSAVYRRDGGRCVFTSVDGRRCDARRGLEYDHIRPWSLGGRSDDPKNIRLLCRAHNQLAARKAGLA